MVKYTSPLAMPLDFSKPAYSREKCVGIKKIKELLNSQGQIEPAVLNRDNVIISANDTDRWWAAKELGWSTFLIVKPIE